MKITLNRGIQTLLIALTWVAAQAQTDYNELTNWYFHPDKVINLIGAYNLDIDVIDETLAVESTISIPNNSEVNTGVDVFWVHPTKLNNSPDEPTTVPLNEQPFAIIPPVILAQGGLLGKYGRFYAPRYQQATSAAFLDPSFSDLERATAIYTAYQDVKAAFENYLENENQGNRIILAGHSQGSFLLAMLLRDVFDNDPELRSRLVTAALAGMPYIFAQDGLFSGGQWENIPLCTTQNQCGCIHAWRSFKESQFIPGLVTTLPVFNTVLVDSGLVFTNVDLETDRFIQDSLYYGVDSSPLRYYIAPDGAYDLSDNANYIAFDAYFTARLKRTSPTKVVLAIDYESNPLDQRPNDLAGEEGSLNFLASGYHSKDYHIYLWALMEQIDAKLEDCASVLGLGDLNNEKEDVLVFPNPNQGHFSIQVERPIGDREKIMVFDSVGRFIEDIAVEQFTEIYLENSGIYFLRFADGSSQRVIVL